MKNTKCITAITVALVLALLMVSSPFMFAAVTTTVDASAASAGAKTATDYTTEELLEFEWPLIGYDSGSTRFSPGPAPDSPDILWIRTIPNRRAINPLAFNGKVFAGNTTHLFALDPFTGNTIWTAPVTSGDPFKLDNTHLMVGSRCLLTETGALVWTAPVSFAGDRYDSEAKLGYAGGSAWDFSDLSQPPIRLWGPKIFDESSYELCADGKLWVDCEEGFMQCVNGTTGEVIWRALAKGDWSERPSYYEDRVIAMGLDNRMYCVNATTGEMLWIYENHSYWGFFNSGVAIAYGMVYVENGDTYDYAFDLYTGKLVWKYKGPGNHYSASPLVADGKVYTQSGNLAYVDPLTGEKVKAELVCLNAYTGKLIWRLPYDFWGSNVADSDIAYGNLYITTQNTRAPLWAQNQIWCIGPTQDWTMFRRDPAHTAQGSGPDKLNLKWTYLTAGPVTSSVSIADGIAYVGSLDQKIHAFDAETGSPIWTFETDYMIRSSPAVVGGKVYTGTEDGYVYCLDAKTGDQLWKTDAGGLRIINQGAVPVIRSSPTVVGGYVYVGSLNNKTYCLNANTGAVQWALDLKGYITASPAVVDGAVYINAGTSNVNNTAAGRFTTLYKLNANTGAIIWKCGIPNTPIRSSNGETHSSPTVAAGLVFVGADARDYYAVNATTGQIKWMHKEDNTAVDNVMSYSCPTYDNGRVFFGDGFSLTCVNATTGIEFWSTWIAREVYTSPTCSWDKVYVTTQNFALYILNATTGKKLDYYEMGSSNVWSNPILYHNRVYLGCGDWKVYCFEQAVPAHEAYFTLGASVDKAQINKGDSVTVSGMTSPVMANFPLKVNFIRPNQTNVLVDATTDATGAYTASYKPDTAGDWSVMALSDATEDWAATWTDTLPLKVVGTTPPPPPPPPPAAEAGIPMEYVYAGVAIVAIAIVVAAGYMLMKRRKKTQKS